MKALCYIWKAWCANWWKVAMLLVMLMLTLITLVWLFTPERVAYWIEVKMDIPAYVPTPIDSQLTSIKQDTTYLTGAISNAVEVYRKANP